MEQKREKQDMFEDMRRKNVLMQTRRRPGNLAGPSSLMRSFSCDGLNIAARPVLGEVRYASTETDWIGRSPQTG
jgi:hypothetical protein